MRNISTFIPLSRLLEKEGKKVKLIGIRNVYYYETLLWFEHHLKENGDKLVK